MRTDRREPPESDQRGSLGSSSGAGPSGEPNRHPSAQSGGSGDNGKKPNDAPDRRNDNGSRPGAGPSGEPNRRYDDVRREYDEWKKKALPYDEWKKRDEEEHKQAEQKRLDRELGDQREGSSRTGEGEKGSVMDDRGDPPHNPYRKATNEGRDKTEL